jgi:hypothetical protein
LLIIEDVVEIGVLGYVCGELGDTFATVRRIDPQNTNDHQQDGAIIIKKYLKS